MLMFLIYTQDIRVKFPAGPLILVVIRIMSFKMFGLEFLGWDWRRKIGCEDGGCCGIFWLGGAFGERYFEASTMAGFDKVC